MMEDKSPVPQGLSQEQLERLRKLFNEFYASREPIFLPKPTRWQKIKWFLIDETKYLWWRLKRFGTKVLLSLVRK